MDNAPPDRRLLGVVPNPPPEPDKHAGAAERRAWEDKMRRYLANYMREVMAKQAMYGQHLVDGMYDGMSQEQRVASKRAKQDAWQAWGDVWRACRAAPGLETISTKSEREACEKDIMVRLKDAHILTDAFAGDGRWCAGEMYDQWVRLRDSVLGEGHGTESARGGPFGI